MMTMEGNKTSQIGTLRMILLWAAVGMKSPQILQVRRAHTSQQAAYCEDLGWRFGCKPLSLLLIGLLDSPSERIFSIWDSLHVRSPSAGIRDGALAGLAAA
jgi:hypothetical protein